MVFLRRIRKILNLLFHGDAVETELDAEVQAFYQTMVDRYIERGVPEREARRLARIEFGHPENVKEEVRDSRTGAALASTVRNVSYALRTMRKAPLFACVTILTFGVGIGANTTIFSVISRFVLRHPPVGDPATLMALHTTQGGGQCCNNFSWPLYSDVREQAKSFSGVTAYYELLPASIDGSGEPERAWGQAVTANFFDVARAGHDGRSRLHAGGRTPAGCRARSPAVAAPLRCGSRHCGQVRPAFRTAVHAWSVSHRRASAALILSSMRNSGYRSTISITCCRTSPILPIAIITGSP